MLKKYKNLIFSLLDTNNYLYLQMHYKRCAMNYGNEQSNIEEI